MFVYPIINEIWNNNVERQVDFFVSTIASSHISYELPVLVGVQDLDPLREPANLKTCPPLVDSSGTMKRVDSSAAFLVEETPSIPLIRGKKKWRCLVATVGI